MSANFSVMFLDDDSYLLSAYQRMLRGVPFHCVFEQSCRRAHNYLGSHSVSLLLADYLMPEQSGLEFCQHKANWMQPTRCYLLSAMHEPLLFKQAEQDSVIQGVLAKPITKSELLAFLHQQQHELLIRNFQE
ncbi:response regulator [Alkalimonas collagenimarina]|uniref:Response regulator n=1 Tax=Alkalimonas collagenimarina TaxID=400390 RepID=A0ABT9GWA8_9GAMM|nr:response regulator [Alkalimonas collagenimarina]MDP4535342.1 response regulator [Alkalimonas collagenimarina]